MIEGELTCLRVPGIQRGFSPFSFSSRVQRMPSLKSGAPRHLGLQVRQAGVVGDAGWHKVGESGNHILRQTYFGRQHFDGTDF